MNLELEVEKLMAQKISEPTAIESLDLVRPYVSLPGGDPQFDRFVQLIYNQGKMDSLKLIRDFIYEEE